MRKKITKILEIGSGFGFESSLLSKKSNSQVTGIDLSSENVKEASSRFPHIEFIKMDATNLKLPKKHFDYIYALDVLEHVDNLNKVIMQIHRVLKKKGILIINVPAEKSEQWLLKIRPTYFNEIHHVRVFKNDDIENLLSAHNFKLLTKKATGFLKHIELYYLFTRKQKSSTQLCIGSRENNFMNKVVYAVTILFDTYCLNTPLKFIPIWIITIPVGLFINLIGNRVMPKSIHYEFCKTK